MIFIIFTRQSIENDMKQALILGIGNILWADEGFGVRAVEQLDRQYQFDANVTVMDGGTQGIVPGSVCRGR